MKLKQAEIHLFLGSVSFQWIFRECITAAVPIAHQLQSWVFFFSFGSHVKLSLEWKYILRKPLLSATSKPNIDISIQNFSWQ